MNLNINLKIKLWILWKRYILSLFKHDMEPYFIGYTHLKLDDIENTLINMGYQPDYFSFDNKGQITSMRKIYITSLGVWRQKHIRAFEDGTITGHDELTFEEDAEAHLRGDTMHSIDAEELVLIQKNITEK